MSKTTIMITGATGVLGRHLIALLKKSKNFKLKILNRQKCDLTNVNQAKTAVTRADCLIHLAGLVLSRIEQQQRSAEVLYQNLASTLNLLEAARQNGIKKVILVSSITAYPAQSRSPLKEEDLWQGPPPLNNFEYGLAKRLVDAAGRAYAKQYGMKITTVVFPNFYGPGDKFNFSPPPLVPSAINQIYEAKQKKLHAFIGGDNGEAGLDLLYVGDAAEALLKMLTSKAWPDLINIGTGKPVKIKDIYKIIAARLGYQGKIVWTSGSVSTRFLHTGLMKKTLKWQPRTSVAEGLSRTVDWFLKKYLTTHA